MEIRTPSLSDVWQWYLRYLVFYDAQSWTASAARTFRVLAVLLITPFALLTLFDVTSYLIARTLGVIDATHASTSDRPFRPEQSHEHEDTPDPSYSTAVPTILVSDESSSGTMQDESLPRPDAPREEVVAARAHEDRLRDAAHVAPVARRPSANSTSYFFTPHEEQSMALSGVGVFSPAGTRTSSPVTERTLLFDGSRRMNSLSELGTKSPQSFTLVEQADEDDESETPGLRKRARPPYASSSAEDDSSD